MPLTGRLTERVMVINTNMSAQSSARLLMESTNLLSKSLARLSSGSKIVSPEDDVAGQAVSARFDAQISRVGAAKTNIANAISFSQTQDGFLKKVAKALDRMSELSILSLDVTKSSADLALYQKEFSTLGEYINDLAAKDYNGVTLFDGSSLSVTIDSEGNTFTMNSVDLNDTAYTAVTTGANVSTTTTAAAALTAVKAAIVQLSTDRAGIGANVSRLTTTADQLGVLKDNLTAANSRIKDVDVAEESTAFARYNILVQAGSAMLAQANTMPQSVLRLLS
jgi:flagellin